MAYESTYQEFAKFHTHPLNVLLHMITTPLCLVAAFALLYISTSQEVLIATLSVYGCSLTMFLPFHLTILNSLSLTGLYFTSIHATYVLDLVKLPEQLASPHIAFSLLFLVSYFGQDLAHFICSEPTYQSSYIKGRNGALVLLGKFAWKCVHFLSNFY
jgi:hypothetical protein